MRDTPPTTPSAPAEAQAAAVDSPPEQSSDASSPVEGTAASPQRNPTTRATNPPAQGHIGFLDMGWPQGKAGGAVVDMQCGLLGMLSSESGKFVRFTPEVVEMIREAVAQLEKDDL